ncbi:MAG: CofH family radical SAM protein [Rikenellaceae bacterium]
MENTLDNIFEALDNGARLSFEQALKLATEAPLARLGAAATKRKETLSGKDVFFNRNFHLEPSNICTYNCTFCSYRKRSGELGSWDYSLEESLEQVRKRKDCGATEIHIVGSIHPRHKLDFYLEMIRDVKKIMPEVTIKAFTAIEIDNMIVSSGLSLDEGLDMLIEAGLEAIPGGGAEIFAPKVREAVCPDKGPAERWLTVHHKAHQRGISTNATMLYGHIESWEDRIDHLMQLREQQDKSKGFNAFIPLKFRSKGNSLSHLGEVSIIEDMRTLAISRLVLDNFPHIKAYWPMLGKTTTAMALCFGADDIDGTIDDSTKIYSMAGADDQKPRMSIEEITNIICSAGYTAVERDTFYNTIKKY